MGIEVTSDTHIHANAYHRGYRDWAKGKLDDPYRKGSLFSKEWQRGQNAAYFANLERISKRHPSHQHKPRKAYANASLSDKSGNPPQRG